MKLLVVGASGGTGRHLVAQALVANHDVRVLARRPDAIERVERLTVQQGDVLDADAVASAVHGRDAVLSVFGPANNAAPGTLMSVGVANLVAGCTRHGVKRFVFESGLMCSDGAGLSWLSRIGVRIAGGIYHKMRDDKRLAERAIQASELDWIIVRPPRLSNRPALGVYQHGVDAPVRSTRSLPHADVAAFLLRCATDDALVRTVQAIGR